MQKSTSKKFKGILISNRNHTEPRSSYVHPLCFPPHHTARGNGSASPSSSTAKLKTVPRDRKLEAAGARGLSHQIYKCWFSANQSYRAVLENFQLKWNFQNQ